MKNRYYQPSDSKDAMRQIEKLFNVYCHEPLTPELLKYHQKLLSQMQTQVLPSAKTEGVAQRVTAANSMIEIMQRWLQLKLNQKPFNGQMRHFKMVLTNQQTTFKRHHVKAPANNKLRSSRH